MAMTRTRSFQSWWDSDEDVREIAFVKVNTHSVLIYWSSTDLSILWCHVPHFPCSLLSLVIAAKIVAIDVF